jgi:hypothetical protein
MPKVGLELDSIFETKNSLISPCRSMRKTPDTRANLAQKSYRLLAGETASRVNLSVKQ